MANGANYLDYALYQDAAGAVWGTSGSALKSVTAESRKPVEYTVFGSIPGGQDQPAGTYGDTVEATVNF
jgi:spore coat protein U-like protein